MRFKPDADYLSINNASCSCVSYEICRVARLSTLRYLGKGSTDLGSMRNDTKLARIRQAMQEGDWDVALKLAAKFHRLGEHGEAITRAANAITNPTTYEQLGFDLAKLRADGIAALKDRYSKSWGRSQNRGRNFGE